MSSAPPTGGDRTDDDVLTAVEVRALLNVALDLADDLDVPCAVAVVDEAGELRGAERPGSLSGAHLDHALESARALLHDGRGEHAGARVGAVALDIGGLTRGALAISGGPDGFAIEACRIAARALGLEAGGSTTTAAA